MVQGTGSSNRLSKNVRILPLLLQRILPSPRQHKRENTAGWKSSYIIVPERMKLHLSSVYAIHIEITKAYDQKDFHELWRTESDYGKQKVNINIAQYSYSWNTNETQVL